MEIGPVKPEPGRLSPRGEIEEKVKAIQKKAQALMKKMQSGTDPATLQDIHNQLKKYQEEITRLTASAVPSRLQAPTGAQQDAIKLVQTLRDDLDAFKKAVNSGNDADVKKIRDEIGSVLHELRENHNDWDPQNSFGYSLDVMQSYFDDLNNWVDQGAGRDALLMGANNIGYWNDYISDGMQG